MEDLAPSVKVAADPDSEAFQSVADRHYLSPATTAGTPMHLFLDPQGRIVFVWHGPLAYAERNLLKEFVEFAVADGPPPIPIDTPANRQAVVEDGAARVMGGELVRFRDIIGSRDQLYVATLVNAGQILHPGYGWGRYYLLTRYATSPSCPKLIFIWVGGRPPSFPDPPGDAEQRILHLYDPDEPLLRQFSPTAAYISGTNFVVQSFLIRGNRGLLKEASNAKFDDPLFPMLLAELCLSPESREEVLTSESE